MTIEQLLQPLLGTTEPLTLNDSPATIPTWDSLAQVNIVSSIEDLTATELSTEEVLRLKTVADIIEVCAAHGVKLETSPQGS